MSWLSSNLVKGDVRERTIITICGISPDIDGIGLFIDLLMRPFGVATNYWGEFHHILHNLSFCMVVTVFSYVLAKTNKIKVACFAFAVFHLHLLCDLVGSKGPDGYQWPIPYLEPFTSEVMITWQYQWELNAWPNILIGLALLLNIIMYAKFYGVSPFEIVSEKANRAFVRIVNRVVFRH